MTDPTPTNPLLPTREPPALPVPSRDASPRPAADPPREPDAWTARRSDPPSVLLVLDALRRGRRLTGAQVREASGLPRRTVYQALRVLRERGAVQHRKSLQDTRQSYFWLAEAANVDAPDALRFGVSGPSSGSVSAAPPSAALT